VIKAQENFDFGAGDWQTTKYQAGTVRGAIFCQADQSLLIEVGDEQ